MVEKKETMADRLRAMKGSMSYEEFGALAGKSATTVMKWMKGGGVKDENLQKLIDSPPFKGRGYTVDALRYGAAHTRGPIDEKRLSALAIDVAYKWMELSPDRQSSIRDLIFMIHAMEQNFPAMRGARPKEEHYGGFERALERDLSKALAKMAGDD